MIIGIIGAMEQEVALLRKQLTQLTIWQQAGCNIYNGYLHGIQVALVQSGIGKVSAALCTTLLLDHFNPTLVINTGSAGGLSPSLEVGDIVVSDEVRYHDVDVTTFGYDRGQIVQCPASFKAAPSLVALAKNITKSIGMHAVCGLIISGDTFINGGQALAYIRHTFPQAIAVEMEATAIAHVCYKFTVPFVVIRAISDIADQVSYESFQDGLIIVVHNLSLLVSEMVQALANKMLV
ncbi:5'-methylthioadenosine/S-adenosylhomocysteine nucleosidase [Candidatus Palibaumannia cicadellinicola]|uniref:5'-methylthioadenosine/S-adenosylhomocysteine nucleosidase n=1 Tax=Candidatus Palibaumannia cicadellinicola TaxID=186490 RepID=A0A088N1B1_9GAMM|nr:5'-methylthioadenosine/S-adenosylhomocysteine nucleosidase [Candidatus Baumannia cicadellinicola]AIN47136.1 5'-methylthioadenosine nucleosidase / S-adenosylhomocysteine nucleosidase [Candidatus Baumannia cicadellinicola]